MKILMVNKFHYIKGGSETYYFGLKKMLEAEGHQVIDFSMADEKNFPSPYSRYFVENVDYEHSKGLHAKLKMAGNIIYSFEAKKKFEDLVKAEKPDLVHLHLFQHQISPSILDICKKHHIPTVYTAHDLKMVCLNYKMMHHGRLCEDCKDGSYLHCAKNRCVKESLPKSCINVAEGYLHRWRKSYDAIDAIITPSAFYRNKFIEFGIGPDRIYHIPNFLERENPIVNEKKNSKQYYLYFGRLSEEKGIMTLLKAMEQLDTPLYIAGTGPLKHQIKEYLKAHQIEHIRVLGFKSGQELIDLVGNAKAVVLPSEWYENGPYSAIEALQLGRPIIGADIGGIPELISENGFLFEYGNIEDLRNKIMQFNNLPSETYHLYEENSQKLYHDQYMWKYHGSKLKQVYQTAIDANNAKR